MGDRHDQAAREVGHAGRRPLDDDRLVDPEGEREVQTALETVLFGRTALVIAHRLQTIARSDRIHVLVAGRVMEEGTHAELLLHGGWYAEAWTLQHPPPAATGTTR